MFFFLIKAPRFWKSCLGARYSCFSISIVVVASEEHMISAIWELSAKNRLWISMYDVNPTINTEVPTSFQLLGICYIHNRGLHLILLYANVFPSPLLRILRNQWETCITFYVNDLNTRISELCLQGWVCSLLSLSVPLKSSLSVNLLY